MPLDLDKIGAVTDPHEHTYDWRDQAVYALGIGARRDELAYLYEGYAGGMRVFPTYAVVPAFGPVIELLKASGANLAMVVHGGQKVVAHRPAPPEATVDTAGTLVGIYDSKRFATIIIRTQTRLGGEPLFDTEWSIIVRDEGRFGGPRLPADADAVKPPKGQEPTWTVEQATAAEQALLYRVSGDTNPLHADPTFAQEVGFEQGPILHGLCTFGFMARAAIDQHTAGDGARLAALGAQFRRPVWPGDTLVTQGWDLGDGTVALQVSVKGRPEPVVSNAWARIAS